MILEANGVEQKMNSPNRQRGMGAAGWLILILVFGSIITAGTKLAPFYLDHNTMSNIMDKMALEDGMKKKPKRQILDTLQEHHDSKISKRNSESLITICKWWGLQKG